VDATALAGLALIALPVAFTLLFAVLGRTFAYPDVLRHPPSEILERFRAGGPRLLVTWWLFALTAVAFVPVAALVAAQLDPAGTDLVTLGLALGVAAGLVQALGLVRWPFLVPLLARRHAAATSDADRAATELVFEAAHRLLGVGVGEHLGYLLSGAWTFVVGIALVASPAHPDWLGLIGLPIGVALMVGSLEFVGRPGERGWSVAERLVPVAYLAWSGWLVAFGVVILAGWS
jgi:hypothetical protein